MNIVLNLQAMSSENEPDDVGASTISIAFVCKDKSTISLFLCLQK